MTARLRAASHRRLATHPTCRDCHEPRPLGTYLGAGRCRPCWEAVAGHGGGVLDAVKAELRADEEAYAVAARAAGAVPS